MSDCVSINPGGHFSGNFQTKKIFWKQFSLNTVYLVIFTPNKFWGCTYKDTRGLEAVNF